MHGSQSVIESERQPDTATVSAERRDDAQPRPAVGTKPTPTATLRVTLADLVSGRHHSRDFSAIRAGYSRSRLLVMQLVFALGFLAWTPIDFALFPYAQAASIAEARIALAVALGALWLAGRHLTDGRWVHGLIAASVFLIAVFHVVVVGGILAGADAAIPDGGYRALPFVLIGITALFPVTLRTGATLVLIPIAMFLLAEAIHGSLLEFATLNMLWMLCFVAGITLWVQVGQLRMLLRMYRESARDPLTGLINRRVLMRSIERQMADEHSRNDFSLILLDIDRFKRVNDDHGHQTGDIVLQRVAELLQQNLRSEDMVGRYGGEEFLAVLPDAHADEAREIAERLRTAISDLVVEGVDGATVNPHISLGITTHQPGETLDASLQRADEALYEAKETGRDRVVYRAASVA
ncbi:MAG: GGDEF domain-containing protein [Halofilum sp. (in: g-proteobacteria)]|nr:GGDEF domain-containing protein [Halofilum sp. (in: g-proteobacteria)]